MKIVARCKYEKRAEEAAEIRANIIAGPSREESISMRNGYKICAAIDYGILM
ncbi:MAG: hypothetical protein LUG84_02660 [Akkermansiaceae bacterium]|nr:hypothetical protein [Akkermansiaceae bacterium]MCD8070776.1 hypothetical protein [Akkermansiaceae bacterium]